MSVKEMTQKGNWVVFGPKSGFAYHQETQRKVDFTNTPTGWNLTAELEAPEDGNAKLQEVIRRNMQQATEPGLPKDLPTHIRRMMTSGHEDLQDELDEGRDALQAWYEEDCPFGGQGGSP